MRPKRSCEPSTSTCARCPAAGGNINCNFLRQLRGYPVFRIKSKLRGIRRFFENMEEAVIHTCRDFGVTATHIAGHPKVWVGEKKICSMGIGVRHWVTLHGLAGVKSTSLSLETGRDIPMKEVTDALAGHFREFFLDSILASASTCRGTPTSRPLRP